LFDFLLFSPSAFQVDGDGRVSLADFRKMLPNSAAPAPGAAGAAAGAAKK